MAISIGIIKEQSSLENRVALVPIVAKEFIKLGFSVYFEQGAGLKAGYADELYHDVSFCKNKLEVIENCQFLLKVQAPDLEESALLKPSNCLVGLLYPFWNQKAVQIWQKHNITSFAIDLIPRISRAQAMDALSSQATVSGYKAVLHAANLCPRFFPMLTTAASTIKPANVLIIGAGVAGLQAIATARRLGATVKVYDIRPEVKEQVESLGAKTLDAGVQVQSSSGYARELSDEEKSKQANLLAEHIKSFDVVISTALIPGKAAPKIITTEMVGTMKNGSVIIDIAAEFGGNCDLTQAGQLVERQGVKIFGPVNLPSEMAYDASLMYSKNLFNFCKLFLNEKNEFEPNYEDPILAGALITQNNMIKNAPLRELIEG